MLKYLPVDLQALLRILVVGIILSAIGGALIFLTPLTENHTALIGAIAVAYSVYRGGQYAASVIHRNGLLHGLRVGLLFFILITIIRFIVIRTPLTFSEFYPTLLLVLAAGGIGGISGVNKERKVYFRSKKAAPAAESEA